MAREEGRGGGGSVGRRKGEFEGVAVNIDRTGGRERALNSIIGPMGWVDSGQSGHAGEGEGAGAGAPRMPVPTKMLTEPTRAEVGSSTAAVAEAGRAAECLQRHTTAAVRPMASALTTAMATTAPMGRAADKVGTGADPAPETGAVHRERERGTAQEGQRGWPNGYAGGGSFVRTERCSPSR
jgi:hypothetical protein